MSKETEVKAKRSVKHKSLIVIGVILLLIALLATIFAGFRIEEERDYLGQIQPSEQQVRQILESDPYWQLPDRGEKAVANQINNMTGDCMKYSFKNDLQNMRGNCEGQAVVCSVAINNAFELRGFKDCYAKPVLAQVFWYGLNMDKILYSITPSKHKHFVANHCVVKVCYSNGEYEYLDPSIFDGIQWTER